MKTKENTGTHEKQMKNKEEQRKINENSTQFSDEELDVELQVFVKSITYVTRMKHFYLTENKWQETM